MDHHDRSRLNFYVGGGLCRVEERRSDERWLQACLGRPDTIVLLTWRSKSLLRDDRSMEPVQVPITELGEAVAHASSVTFLGQLAENPLFGIDLAAADDGVPERYARYGRFVDLREIGSLLERDAGALLAYARAMAYWHHRHQFCGTCGSTTVSAEGGHQRSCTNAGCAHKHFPRMDPAVIVLVTRRDRCLLARQAGWSDRLHSVVAGFVEPGESIEAAVLRELFAETGVHVGEITYQSSQPWPFPSSLMLGFTAAGLSETITRHDGELEDARWFTRREIAETVAAGALRLPTTASIAYRLIEDWFDADGTSRLSDII
jgi:NAD+ diphosphatase